MSHGPIQMRPYKPERDEPQAYALWQRTLATEWPLSQAAENMEL